MRGIEYYGFHLHCFCLRLFAFSIALPVASIVMAFYGDCVVGAMQIAGT